MMMTIARESGCGTRRKRRAPKYPPASASTAIGTAKRQSTIRAITNGTKRDAVDRHRKHVLDCILRVEAREAGKREYGEHQDSHARAEIAAIHRDGKLRGDLPRSVTRCALRCGAPARG